jgi:diguanylate cyclase (GGDEF)-like protein/PAS domain S-box-containing protein
LVRHRHVAIPTRPLLNSLDHLAHWRNQLFNKVLTIVLVLGLLTAIPSVMLLGGNTLAVLALDGAALSWIATLRLAQGLAYRTRVLQFLAMNLMFGCALMVTVGPSSQSYLAAGPMMAALLLGTSEALATTLIGTVAIFIISYAGIGAVHLVGATRDSLGQSLLMALSYAFIATVTILSCAFLLQRLARSLADLRTTADSLEDGKRALCAVNAELSLTAAALSHLSDMVLIARINEQPGAHHQPIIYVNDAFERRTGYSRAEVIGGSWNILLPSSADPAEVARIGSAIKRGQAVSSELQYATRDGVLYWVVFELKPFADAGGVQTHWVGIAHDITERKKAETAIHKLAFYDVLTGLPNRRLLMERLDALRAASVAGAGIGALMFIDLDNFKLVNDARGHAIGDDLLTSAAERLLRLVAPHDTVARLGGDEFVVLLARLGDDGAAATGRALALAERIRRAIAEGFAIDGHGYQSSASIGVTLVDGQAATVQDLLREADTAMYRAKAGGRNRVVLFEATMRAAMERRLAMQDDLAAAVAAVAADSSSGGELSMHLQLQVDAAGAPLGAEMLMRWRRADGSMVPPDQFIPVAEENGLIVGLGQFALRAACDAWHRLERAGHRMPLSVNVSPSQFRHPEFVDEVRALLLNTATPADQLIFEVTESLLVDYQDQAIARMHELAALGVRISIDDFGTGYSSLAYLKRLPLFELKIDRSFIRDTPDDANGIAIVQTIIAMAAHLGLRVVAEGVETATQARFLAANGAPAMQGFLFARPLPLDEVIAQLDRAGRSPAA